MNLEYAFLCDINDNPGSDAPRLIYADWLQDRGGPGDAERAEFIRVQIELAHGDEGDPAGPAQRQRERALLQAHQAAWLAHLQSFSYPGGLHFERGFVAGVTLSAQRLEEYGEQLFQLAPIQRLRLKHHAWWDHPPGRPLRVMLCSPWLQHIVSLALDTCGAEAAGEMTAGLAGAPFRTQLRELDLGGQTPELVLRLLSRVPLPSLEVLHLSSCELGDPGVRTLAGLVNLRHISTLTLDRNDVGPAGIEALCASRHRARLKHLSFEENPLRPEGVRILVNHRLLVGSASLCLDRCRLGDQGARTLAHSPELGNVTALRLRNNDIGDRGANALTASPYLAGLTTLDLARNRIRDGGEKALRQRFGLALKL
jgi:uncharacterized protein (TIGR02996 family)